MLKFLEVAKNLRAIKTAFAAGDYLVAMTAAVDLIEGLGFTDQAEEIRQIIEGVQVADAREIAVGVMKVVVDLLNTVFGFATPINVKSVPVKGGKGGTVEADLEAVAVCCDQEAAKPKAKAAMTATPIAGIDPTMVLAVFQLIAEIFSYFRANHGGD